MNFEVFKKDITIKLMNGKEQKITLRPLSGRFLPKLYSIMEKMQKKDDGKMSIDEDTMSKFHELALATMIKSYPDQDKEVLDEFVSQNLVQMIEGIIKVNINASEE